MSEWYYGVNGVQQVPAPLESLVAMTATGQLKRSDLVWTEGMTAWRAAGTIPQLFPAVAAPPPLPARMAQIGYAAPPPPTVASGSALGQDAGMRWLLPVGRSGWAIAAGYLGLFSVLIIPAPLSLICSIIAIRDIRRHPQRHGMGRAIFGLVMGILGSIACGLLVVNVMGPSLRRMF